MNRYHRLLWWLVVVAGTMTFFRFVLEDQMANELSAATIFLASLVYALVMLRWTNPWDNQAIAAFFLVVGLALVYGGATARNLDLLGPLGHTQRACTRSFLVVGSLLGVFETCRWGIRKAKQARFGKWIRSKRTDFRANLF